MHPEIIIPEDDYLYGYIVGLYKLPLPIPNISFYPPRESFNSGWIDGHGDYETYYAHREWKPGQGRNGAEYAKHGDIVILYDQSYYLDPMCVYDVPLDNRYQRNDLIVQSVGDIWIYYSNTQEWVDPDLLEAHIVCDQE